MTTPEDCKFVADRIERHITTISTLAQLLLNNGGYKGDAEDIDKPPQIDDWGESGIQQAIKLLADGAHRDFCRMTTDLGVPACD